MPPFKKWASDKQRRWGNSSGGHAALSAEDIAGKNASSKGMDLSEAVGKEKTIGHRKKKKGGVMSRALGMRYSIVAGVLGALLGLACATAPAQRKEPAEAKALRLYSAFETNAKDTMLVWTQVKKSRDAKLLEHQPGINGLYARYQNAQVKFKAEIETWRGRPSEFCCDYPEMWDVADALEKLRRAVHTATGKDVPAGSYTEIMQEARLPKGKRAA